MGGCYLYIFDMYSCYLVSSSQTKTIFSHFINPFEHLLQDTEKQKGKQAMPEKHEGEMSQVKQKSKKLLNVKKEIPADVKGR